MEIQTAGLHIRGENLVECGAEQVQVRVLAAFPGWPDQPRVALVVPGTKQPGDPVEVGTPFREQGPRTRARARQQGQSRMATGNIDKHCTDRIAALVAAMYLEFPSTCPSSWLAVSGRTRTRFSPSDPSTEWSLFFLAPTR